MFRQIVLDTETTGLEPELGHRVIEIGCVELINRRVTHKVFQQYLNPERDIDKAATEVHGMTRTDLAEEKKFVEIANEFLNFVSGAELIIHNAPFDVGFIDNELKIAECAVTSIEECCTVTDTLALARSLHPGQKNSLDALCRRYEIDNSQRQLHGALLDANILADVYLAMTGGQAALSLGGHSTDPTNIATGRAHDHRAIDGSALNLVVVAANANEMSAHEKRLDAIEKSGGRCVWRNTLEKP